VCTGGASRGKGPFLAVGGAEAVAADELPAGLGGDLAVDVDRAAAHQLLGLSAGVGQADDLDGLGQRDRIALQRERGHSSMVSENQSRERQRAGTPRPPADARGSNAGYTR